MTADGPRLMRGRSARSAFLALLGRIRHGISKGLHYRRGVAMIKPIDFEG